MCVCAVHTNCAKLRTVAHRCASSGRWACGVWVRAVHACGALLCLVVLGCACSRCGVILVGVGSCLRPSLNHVVAKREVSNRVAPMTEKHIGKGTILSFRRTAVIAWDVGRNIGYRNEEGKYQINSEHQSQDCIPASHASRGSLVGRIILLMRTALVALCGFESVNPIDQYHGSNWGNRRPEEN